MLSQFTSFQCPVSCMRLGLVTYFIYSNIHVSMLLNLFLYCSVLLFYFHSSFDVFKITYIYLNCSLFKIVLFPLDLGMLTILSALPSVLHDSLSLSINSNFYCEFFFFFFFFFQLLINLEPPPLLSNKAVKTWHL